MTIGLYRDVWIAAIASSRTSLATLIYPIICLKSVDVRRMQVVILALSPREMSQTDRILPRYILSRVRVLFRPRFFIREKTANHSRPHTSILDAEINNAIGSRTETFDYDVTRCEYREPGSNPMQGTIFFHFFCLRLTVLTLNKS